MAELDLKSLPPPPSPPILNNDKEEGELSDLEEISNKSDIKSCSSKDVKKNEESKVVKLEERSDIQFFGDESFTIDDDGYDLKQNNNIDDDEVFNKMKEDVGIDDEINISINIEKTPKATRREGTCFNCGGPHSLNECITPHDRQKINQNRRSLNSSKKSRMMNRSEPRFKPGELSAAALEALGLNDDEYPLWILKMREIGSFKGYPPGYLKHLKPNQKQLTFFCDDADLTSEIKKEPHEFDRSKLVWYDGFNLIDRNSAPEKRINRNVNPNFQWPAYTKESYSKELEQFLKKEAERINHQKLTETDRKRVHDGDDDQQPPMIKQGRYDNDTKVATPALPNSAVNNDKKEKSDVALSSRVLTEEEAKPKQFLVAVVDDRKMPDTKNFSAGITPFYYDNLAERTNTMDKLEELLKSIKK